MVVAFTPVEQAVRSSRAAWRRTAGSVVVVPIADAARIADEYALLLLPDDGAGGGALDPVAQVFVLFNALVLEHSLAPLVVHIAFLGIAEYRENLAPALADPSLPRRPCANVYMLEPRAHCRQGGDQAI